MPKSINVVSICQIPKYFFFNEIRKLEYVTNDDGNYIKINDTPFVYEGDTLYIDVLGSRTADDILAEEELHKTDPQAEYPRNVMRTVAIVEAIDHTGNKVNLLDVTKDIVSKFSN